jgi:hypothetical protein
MSVSRRKFLLQGGLAGICMALPAELAAQRRAVGQGDDNRPNLGHIKPHGASQVPMVRSSFLPNVGSTFAVQEGTVNKGWLTLLAVEDMPQAPQMNSASMAVAPKSVTHQQQCDAFALHFRISANQSLKQGTYVLNHDMLGAFPLFVVAGSRESQTCTAIIAHVIG